MSRQEVNYEVVCICGGSGFPSGVGSSVRITMVGKALQLAGASLRVLHFGPSPLPVNTQASGVFEGIPFEYTTRIRRPSNTVLRAAVYIWGILRLTARLVMLRSAADRTAVWLYIMGGPEHLYISWLCRRLRLPLVQELCEWYPGHPACSRFTRWLYRVRLFRNTTGALVISKLIEERAREVAAAANPRLRIHRLPAIVDARRFADVPESNSVDEDEDPVFLWCGTEERGGDVDFLIRVAGLVQREGYRAKLRIVGTCSDRRRAEIHDYANRQGILPGSVIPTGYVDDRRLAALLRSATALLLPLRDDDRSRTRMPNKLGEYLASGRPVVTCKVGDLTDFLEDGVNAYMAEPGDETGFAEQMLAVLRDPAAADRIGAAGQRACAAWLDYRPHAIELARFFKECIISRRRNLRPHPVSAMDGLGTRGESEGAF